MKRLNIGAGKIPLWGYINLDIRPGSFIDVVHDARTLKEIYQDGTFDEIMAGDVLEHLGLWKWKPALQDWVDLLKPGGVLKMRTIDVRRAIEYFMVMKAVEGYDQKENYNKFVHFLFGDQDYPENTHNVTFTEEYLREDLVEMGMKVLNIWHDGGYLMRVTAVKGDNEPLVSLDHFDYRWKEFQLR